MWFNSNTILNIDHGLDIYIKFNNNNKNDWFSHEKYCVVCYFECNTIWLMDIVFNLISVLEVKSKNCGLSGIRYKDANID